MENSFIKRLFAIAFIGSFCLFLSACKRDYSCECTEYYEGADTSWSKFHADTVLTYKKKEVDEACDALDGEKQTYFTESYWLDCEVK